MQRGAYPNKSYNEYVSRVNRAIDYIQKNINKNLTLEKISKQAYFSPFHFHRIFKAIMGETLNIYIKRIRLEKALFLLMYNAEMEITKIALKCGFASSQSFAKAFKHYFKQTPSEFRKNRKIGHMNSKIGKDFICEYKYDELESRPQATFKSVTKNIMKVEVKKMPEMHLAYVRHIGDYKGNSELFEKLFGELCGWAGPRGLIQKDTKFLSIYYDNPSFTDEDRLRLDVCLTVDSEVEVSGKIGKQLMQEGQYAVSRFELKNSGEYEKAWESLYKDWLPKSGYQPDDRPAYEIYLNSPKEHPEGIHIVEICLPVKEL